MPLQIQRTASVYRLWDDHDLWELFSVLAATGWVCTVTAAGAEPVSVQLQSTSTRQLVSATRSQVVVSDGVTVVAQSLGEFNAANPTNSIEESGS